MSLVVLLLFLRGEIEFGTISQTSFAFSSISQALSVIITNLVSAVSAMSSLLRHGAAPYARALPESPKLFYTKQEVDSPAENQFLIDVSFETMWNFSVLENQYKRYTCILRGVCVHIWRSCSAHCHHQFNPVSILQMTNNNNNNNTDNPGTVVQSMVWCGVVCYGTRQSSKTHQP